MKIPMKKAIKNNPARLEITRGVKGFSVLAASFSNNLA
jgi:hypothetical protein